MTEDKIIKILQASRQIEPRAEFKMRSREQILNLPPKNIVNGFQFRIFESLKFGAAITFAAAFLFILVGGASYFIGNQSSSLLAGLDERGLSEEAAGLDFKIELGEAKYFDDSAEQIAALLEELSKSGKEKGPGNSNKIILNSIVL